MIGSGIAAHTAFGAFGLRRLFPELETSSWAFIPWIAPSVVGTIAIVWLTRHYRQAFREGSRTGAMVPEPASSQRLHAD